MQMVTHQQRASGVRGHPDMQILHRGTTCFLRNPEEWVGVEGSQLEKDELS